MNNEWYNELEDLMYEDSITDKTPVQDELEIMICLYENGYNKKDFDVILTRMKMLGISKEEAIIKIKTKKR